MLATANALEGTHTISTREEADRLLVRVNEVRKELQLLRTEHRDRIIQARRAWPGWRHVAVMSVAISRAEAGARSLGTALASVIEVLDHAVRQLREVRRQY